MKTELIDKLKEFSKVANELSELWLSEEDPNDVINCINYPFKLSFDEVVAEIDVWVDDNIIKFKSGWFHTHLEVEELCSNSLADIERELEKFCDCKLGKPIIYKHADLPDSFKEDIDENLYDYILVYPVNVYIGILK